MAVVAQFVKWIVGIPELLRLYKVYSIIISLVFPWSNSFYVHPFHYDRANFVCRRLLNSGPSPPWRNFSSPLSRPRRTSTASPRIRLLRAPKTLLPPGRPSAQRALPWAWPRHSISYARSARGCRQKSKVSTRRNGPAFCKQMMDWFFSMTVDLREHLVGKIIEGFVWTGVCRGLCHHNNQATPFYPQATLLVQDVDSFQSLRSCPISKSVFWLPSCC